MEEWVTTLTTQGPTGLGWLRFLIIGFAATAAIAGLTIGLLPPLARWITPRPDRGRFKDFVSLKKVRKNGVVEAKNGWLAAAWVLNGIDHQGMSDRRRDSLYEARRHTLDQIAAQAKAQLELRIISRREKTAEAIAEAPRVEEAMPDGLREISSRWAKAQQGRTYRNHHYVLAFVRQGTDGENAIEGTHEAIMAGLDEYEPKRLDGEGEEGPMKIFGTLLSPVSRPAPTCKESDRLIELVCTDRTAIYPDGRVRATHGPHEHWTTVMGVRQIDDTMKEQTMISLLNLECEHTIVQSVRPLSKSFQKTDLMRQSRQGMNAMLGSGGRDQMEEVYEIIDGTHVSQLKSEIYHYQMVVLAHGATEGELENSVNEVRRVMLLAGSSVHREGIMAESLLWGVLPGFDVYALPWRLLSFPIASSWVPQAGAQGVQAHDWANHSITAFRSAQGSAYHFTWHPSAEPDSLGHCAVIAPAGAGKTTLLSHLAGQTLRIPSAKVWVFDRFNGTEIFTHAMEGAYVRFENEDGAKAVRLNPLLLDDNGRSRAFLRRWIAGLIPGEKSAEDRKSIEHAIKLNFEYAAPERRRLELILPSAFKPKSKAIQMLERWYSDDEIGRIFNAEEDDIGRIDHRWVAFDCTQAFGNELLAPTLIQYLMYRIQERSRLRGEPSLVIVDETEPMLRTPEFREAFMVGLQEGRKLHQVFVCCFQKPSAIEAAGIGDLIRGMCPTIIFSANEQADPQDYKGFNLSDADMDFIMRRTHRELRHGMLIKRYGYPNSAVIDSSLAGLGPWLGAFKSGPQDIARVRNLMNTLGPSEGVQRYIDGKERTGVR